MDTKYDHEARQAEIREAKRLELEKRERMLAVAVERVQNAVDAKAPQSRILKLIMEARACEQDVESVKIRGRVLNRQERRERGIESRVQNGYQGPAW